MMVASGTGRLTPRWQVAQVTVTPGVGLPGMLSMRRFTSCTMRIICRATSLLRFSSLAKSMRSSGAPTGPTWQNVHSTPSPPATLRMLPQTCVGDEFLGRTWRLMSESGGHLPGGWAPNASAASRRQTARQERMSRSSGRGRETASSVGRTADQRSQCSAILTPLIGACGLMAPMVDLVARLERRRVLDSAVALAARMLRNDHRRRADVVPVVALRELVTETGALILDQRAAFTSRCVCRVHFHLDGVDPWRDHRLPVSSIQHEVLASQLPDVRVGPSIADALEAIPRRGAAVPVIPRPVAAGDVERVRVEHAEA